MDAVQSSNMTTKPPFSNNNSSNMPRVRRSATTTALLFFAALLQTAVLLAGVRADYSPKDDVVILTDKNFEKEVLQSNDYWLVEFYAPWCGHCKQLEPEYKAAAKKLKKHARLGAVDATVHQALAQKYQIQGYPTIKEFGAKKSKPSDYRGGRTARDIVAYVKSSDAAKALGVRSASVTTLEFAHVHTFVTTHAAVPSAIFFGSSTSAKKSKKKASSKPPSWLSDVAEEFTTAAKGKKGKKKAAKVPTVNVAFVPGTEGKIAKHFGLDESQLPAVVFVTAGGAKFAVSDAQPLNEATAKRFIAASLALDAAAVEQLAGVPLFPAPEVAKKKPRAHVDRLDEVTMRTCLKKSGKMCVVIASTSTSRDETLKALAKTYRRDPFTFLASDASDVIFQSLTSFLGAQASDVLVLKPGKKVKYAALADSRDEQAIAQFLDKILGGAITFTPLSIQDSKVDLDLAGKAAGGATESDAHAAHEEL